MRFLLTALLLLPALSAAQQLHTFKNGEVADADKVNENFELLRDELSAVEATIPRNPWSENLAYHAVTVDCTDNSLALEEAFTSVHPLDPIAYLIKGTCELNSSIEGRNLAVTSADNDIANNILTSSGEGGDINLRHSSLFLTEVALDLRSVSGSMGSSLMISSVDWTNRRGSEYVSKLKFSSGSQIYFSANAKRGESTWPDIEVRLWSSSSLRIDTPNFSFNNIRAALTSTVWCNRCGGADLGSITLQSGSAVCTWDSSDPVALDSLVVGTNSTFVESIYGSDPPEEPAYPVTQDESSSVVFERSLACLDYSSNPS